MSKKLYLFGKGAGIKLVISWLSKLYYFSVVDVLKEKVTSWSESVMTKETKVQRA